MQKGTRTFAATCVTAAGAALFVRAVSPHYPPSEWLLFRYLGYLAISLAWLAGCIGGGMRVLRQLGIAPMRGDRWVVAAPLGVLLFFLAMFVLGVAHLFHPATALGVGALQLWLGVREFWYPALHPSLPQTLFSRPAHVLTSRLSLRADWLLSILGFAAIALIYATICTPDNLGYDARWYHLPLAEHYVAAAGIEPFAEGSYPGAYPQLATLLYSWALLLPTPSYFDKVLLCAHLELVLFLATLLQVSTLVRRLAPRTYSPFAFVAVFLFPGVLLYDGALFTAADHVLAFFSIPIWISFAHVFRSGDRRDGLVFGALCAAAALTKYQAGSVLAFPWAALCFRLILLHARPEDRRATASANGKLPGRRDHLTALSVAALSAAAISAPHWLKNAIFYHDPFYPLLHEHLPSRPFAAGAEEAFARMAEATFWRPAGTLWQRLAETAWGVCSFSFVPHDWPTYHGSIPVFGSLFTLLLPLVFLLRLRRLCSLTAATMMGIACWYWVSHQDRYLQTLLPWMAVVVWIVLVRSWQTGGALRFGVACLCGLQLAWGLDVPLIHAKDASPEFDKPAPLLAAYDLFAAGFRGERAQRFRRFEPWQTIAFGLSASATVLVHERQLHLGLSRKTVTDRAGWQGGVSYGALASSSDVQQLLGRLKVTHVVWDEQESQGTDSIASDLRFFQWVQDSALATVRVGGLLVAALPDAAAAPLTIAREIAPATEPPRRARAGGDAPLVLWKQCGDPSPRWSWYALRQLQEVGTDAVTEPALATSIGVAPPVVPHSDRDAQLVSWLVTDAACLPDPAYVLLARRHGLRLWTKTSGS